jgi:hypothetical protein
MTRFFPNRGVGRDRRRQRQLGPVQPALPRRGRWGNGRFNTPIDGAETVGAG